MSLAELMKPMDTPVTVGVLAAGDVHIAVYMVDFGEEYPPMDKILSRYKKLTLDIEPSANGATYCVTSDKVLAEITGKHFDLMPEKSLEEVFREAARTATPEFASSTHVSQVGHDNFQSARQNLNGFWVLVVLTSQATEVLLDASDIVVHVVQKARNAYRNAG